MLGTEALWTVLEENISLAGIMWSRWTSPNTLSPAPLPFLFPPGSPDGWVGNEDLGFHSSVVPSCPFIWGASCPPEAASWSAPPPLPLHKDGFPCGKTPGTQHLPWGRKYPFFAMSFKPILLNNKDKVPMSICFTPFPKPSSYSEFRGRKYGASANPIPTSWYIGCSQ